MTDYNELEDSSLPFVEYVQSQLKFILSFIIITNFIIIFSLKFSISIQQKFESFFDIKKDNDQSKEKKEVLIIIAHPDDEIMFLTPTIKSLLIKKIKFRILCLSNGNFDGLGKIREEEFSKICKELKIEDYEIMNDERLQDNIRIKWDSEYIKQKLNDYLNKEDNYGKIGTIITFDEKGVTSHPNHISCYEGLIAFLKENKEKLKSLKTNSYLLDTYNPVSQYTLILPLIFFYFKEFGFFNKNFLYNWRLMKIYNSQFNFNRKLHVILSSYTYSNTFTRLEFS